MNGNGNKVDDSNLVSSLIPLIIDVIFWCHNPHLLTDSRLPDILALSCWYSLLIYVTILTLGSAIKDVKIYLIPITGTNCTMEATDEISC